HMGIVAQSKEGGMIVYQSNGTGYPDNDKDQIKNLGSTRGVQPKGLNEMITLRYSSTKELVWGDNYDIFRLEELGYNGSVNVLPAGQYAFSIIRYLEDYKSWRDCVVTGVFSDIEFVYRPGDYCQTCPPPLTLTISESAGCLGGERKGRAYFYISDVWQ